MTPTELEKIVEDTAIELAVRAGRDMSELRDSGVDCTPLPGETFLGTLLRLAGIPVEKSE